MRTAQIKLVHLAELRMCQMPLELPCNDVSWVNGASMKPGLHDFSEDQVSPTSPFSGNLHTGCAVLEVLFIHNAKTEAFDRGMFSKLFPSSITTW